MAINMERSVRAVLRAEVSGYVSDMDRAAKATAGVGVAGKQAARDTQQATQQQTTQARSFSQRLVAHAQENEQAWTRVGGTLAVTGGAVSALMGTVLNTGISYNQLRQQSVAALTTLTGSAEDANAQMARLDDFASNSPFARDVFIRAQQQMLGFGIEARKVIPYLDAIQNAVAAAGGSNQDIAELSRIFSQISASAKITATDLQQFGNRGIDAATLIGSQMGKTGAQIREEITAGTLDAGEALDALAAGMAATYDGAAANVKNTFDGAVDRVRAAFRDISSIIAEPLVGREGGGLLTGFLNQIADVLRTIEKLPTPVLQILGGLTGVAGVAATSAGALALALPRYAQFHTALDQIAGVAPRFASAMGRIDGIFRRGLYLGGVAAVAAALTGLLGALTRGLDELVSGGPKAAQTVEEITSSLRSLEAGSDDAAVALHNLFDFGAQRGIGEHIFRGIIGSFGIMTSEVRSFGEAVELAFGDSLINQANRFWDDLMSKIPGVTTDLEVAREQFQAFDDAIVAAVDGGNIDEAARMYDVMAQNLEALGYDADFIAQVLPNATGALETAGDSAQDAAPKFARAGIEFEQMVENFQRGAASFEDPFTEAERGFDAWIKNLTRARREQERWAEQMLKAAALVRRELPPELQAMGMEMISELQAMGAEGMPILNEWINQLPEQRAEIIQELNGIRTDMEGQDYRIPFEFFMDSELSLQAAEVGMEVLRDYVFGAPQPTTMIDADPDQAYEIVRTLLDQVDESDGTIDILGFSLPAKQVLSSLLDDVERSKASTNIDARDPDARTRLRGLLTQIGRSRAYTNVDANLKDAERKTRNFQPPPKTVRITPDMTSVRNAINNYWPTITARIRGIFTFAGGGPVIEGYSTGGPVRGPGTGTSDSIVAADQYGSPRYRLSHGEHIVTAAEVQAIGGHDAMLELRSMMRTGELRQALTGQTYADGGQVGAPTNLATLAPPAPQPSQVTATLDAESKALLRAVADRPVELRMNQRVLAEAMSDAGAYGQARGQGGHH